LTLDDFLELKRFSVLVDKSTSLFVGMPSKILKDGKYYDYIEFKKSIKDFPKAQYEIAMSVSYGD
jgi:DNA-binding cell septation regulator SpoVG